MYYPFLHNDTEASLIILNLCNLTAEKDCSLVEREGGLSLLEELINSNVPKLPYQRVIDLASAVRDNVTKWKEREKLKTSDR